MRELPPIRYTKIGDESIAYRDLGGDGLPLVYLGSSGSHQDLIWDEPGYAHFLRSLATLGRLITLDRRGSGLSSHTVKPTIEARVADIAAVLDALELDDGVLIGNSGSSQGALAFAATYPERCRALILYSPSARTSRADDYEIGIPPELLDLALSVVESMWGTGFAAALYAPSLADDHQFVAWSAKLERGMATPNEAREWLLMYDETDVRDVLPHVHAPVLVVTPAAGDEYTPALSRYVAENLPNATSIDVAARDQWCFGDGANAFLAAITDFLPEVLHVELATVSERRLAAVLFTDIVASTEQLQVTGDRQWRAVLDSHDEVTERSIERQGGRVVKSTGDGALAVFNGPAQAVFAALDLVHALTRVGLDVRAGVHVGEIEERSGDVTGIAVHIGSRIADLAGPGEVFVSTTVRDLVAGSGLEFEPRGAHSVKGLADSVTVLAASRAPV